MVMIRWFLCWTASIVDKKPALPTFIIIGVSYNWVVEQMARARKSCCAPREQRARPVLRNTAPNWLTMDGRLLSVDDHCQSQAQDYNMENCVPRTFSLKAFQHGLVTRINTIFDNSK